jgi:hypothetical protein
MNNYQTRISTGILKYSFFFMLPIFFVSLVACQKTASQEAIQYETRSDVYAHFITDPQTGKEKLIENYGQGTNELLQGILLSNAAPPTSAIDVFSQLFAEAYAKATDKTLSELENARYADVLGGIMGHLTTLRNHVVKRRQRLFLIMNNYDKFDERWLRLLMDITSLTLPELSIEKKVEFAQPGATDKFKEVLKQSALGVNENKEDYVKSLIYRIEDAVQAGFNGHEQNTGRRVSNDFNTRFNRAYRHSSEKLARQ